MLRIGVITGLVVAAWLLPGRAAAAPETSPGVRLVTTIPEPGVVSAKAIGRYLYVSSLSGVSIYDVLIPYTPELVGRLELPNAQNEDVDIGSGIMLVSDDPVGGRGVLHIVDVRNPRAPRVLSTYRTWRRGGRGIGHTATCIRRCRYAWLAGGRGIEIVDLRRPSRPRLAGRFPARAASGFWGVHDVQVDRSGLAWVGGGMGTAAYDVSDPVRPRLVKRTDWHAYPGSGWNDFIHHNTLRLRRNVLAVTEEAFGLGCAGAGRLQTWRISRRRQLTPLDSFRVERDWSSQLLCSAHWFDAHDGLIAQGFYEQGVRFVDARRPRHLRQVGYYVNRPGLFWGALFAPNDPYGETVYALDHSRGIDVLDLRRGKLRPVRRPGVWPPPDLTPVPDPNFTLEFSGGFEDVVPPGASVRLTVRPKGGIGPADVRVTLPAELIDVQVPPDVGYDPVSRTVHASLPTTSFSSWDIAARVATTSRAGTQLEVIGYIRGAGDPLPLDDRAVHRSVVGRRTGAAVASSRRFCRLPSDYTL